MDRRRYEELAKTWLSALGRNDIDTMSGISTDDLIWWIVPGNKFSGTHAKSEFYVLTEIFRRAGESKGGLTVED